MLGTSPGRARRGLAAGLTLAGVMALALTLVTGPARAESLPVRIDAVIADGGTPIQGELALRIWAMNRGGGQLVARHNGAPAQLDLEPGRYRVLAKYRDARRVTDITVGGSGAQRHVINLNAGEVALSLLPSIHAQPIDAPLQWEVRRYARGSAEGAKVADVRHRRPRLLLSEGWYEVQVRHGGRAVEHVIEVAAGQRYDYAIVMNQ